MGEVYRAKDQVLDREVAIKLMLPIPKTLAAAERFAREARAAAMLSDPHVVATHDFGRHGAGYFLVMEVVEGRTVSEELRRTGPFAAGQALDIVRQAASGLAAAHRLGLVHRDIKTANLLLTDNGQVKVADFGIVRFLDDTTTTLTATGQIVGTTHYLAPERVLGRPAEQPSDVYALGCVLYQLVTGHPPFVADDPASIMYQQLEATPEPPSRERPELAGDFEAFLFWLLAKDPALRPTAAQVAQGAAPPSIAGDTTPQQWATEPTAVLNRPNTSRNVLAAAVAAVTLALASTAGILLNTHTTKPPATTNLNPGPSATPPVPHRSSPEPTPTASSTPKTSSHRTYTTRPAKPTAKPKGKTTKSNRPSTKTHKNPKH